MNRAFRVVNAGGAGDWVLTCEHASRAIPCAYGDLGVRREDRRTHVAWDIGAAVVARTLAAALAAPLVEAAYSRLLIDCNRAPTDGDLIVEAVHGVRVPGNAGIDAAERERRLARYYGPYHEAIEAVLSAGPAERQLLSVHSFTPELGGQRRDFDIGVLYDDWADLGERLAAELAASGFRVRRNEPYSAHEGLIFSASTHGRRHGMRYAEIEVNNALVHREAGAHRVARRIGAALRRVR